MGAQQNCDMSGSQRHVPRINSNWQMCGINETHWTAIYRDSTGWVMGIEDCRLRRFYYVCTFSYSVYCVWVANKTATYRDPRYTCRNQLNIVLHVKNQKLTEDAGSLVNIIIWHVCRRYMKHWTTIYRESTRCVLGIWNCCTMWLMFAPLSHSISFLSGWWV